MRTLWIVASGIATLTAFAAGVDPAFATVAADLCPPAANPCTVSGTLTLTPGSDIDLGDRALIVGSSARLTIGAGEVRISAGAVRLQPGARITGSAGAASSNLIVTSKGAIALEASGSTRSRIDVSAGLLQGLIQLTAGTDITMAGELLANGGSADADGGFILLDARAGKVTVTGPLSAKGGSASGGGNVVVYAGGAAELAEVVDVSAGDIGGGELTVVAGGDVIMRKDLLAGSGGSGDGGSLSIDTRGTVTLIGAVKADGSGNREGGGDGGEVAITADGSVTMSGQWSLTGGFPDAEGGSVFVQTGGSFQQGNAISVLGNGIDGCGGSVDISAARDVTLARINASASSCGAGDVGIEAFGTVTTTNLINADGLTSISPAGTVFLRGRDIQVRSTLRADGATNAPAGFIGLTGCNVTIASQGEVRTNGLGGGNTIQASGRAEVRGALRSSLGGVNRIVYRDPALPPIIAATVTPSAVLEIDPQLPPCPGESATCGDGTLDPGEECDDGNNTACDGCGASCRLETCGNNRVECREECDAGALNGVPGSGCDAECKVVPLPGGLLLLPGGRTRNSCMAEWQIKNPGGVVKDGFPATIQTCIDGDPGCDQDGATNGACVFQTAICLRVTDARLPQCNPKPLESVSINKPNLLKPANAVDAANGVVLRDALAALGGTVRGGTNVVVPGVPETQRDRCTAPVGILVPHAPGLPGSRTLYIAARDGEGARMRENQVTLTCAPNTAVCGNGTREIGEQCDDGNDRACDGCAPTCRAEVCGDGIVECGEQCDDGPANGTPDSRCTTQCTEVVPALRIPGGGSARSDCLLRAAVDTQTPTLKRNGTPSNKQVCVDNDPACDFDPAPGTCRFKTWLCLGGEDAGLGCVADAIVTAELRAPRERDTGAAAALRRALVERLGALSFPLPAGERCTGRVDVEVTAGRKEAKLGVRVQGARGDRDTDTFKFKCLAPKP